MRNIYKLGFVAILLCGVFALCTKPEEQPEQAKFSAKDIAGQWRATVSYEAQEWGFYPSSGMAIRDVTDCKGICTTTIFTYNTDADTVTLYGFEYPDTFEYITTFLDYQIPGAVLHVKEKGKAPGHIDKLQYLIRTN